MSIILPHLSTAFKKNEIKTLEFICARGFFDNDFSELAGAISSTYSRYRNVNLKKNIDFEFVSDFEMEIEKKNHRVVLHAQVVGNYKLTTYSLGICANDNSSKLIRRFHFDYVHNNSGLKQKVPVSHLQYGGRSGVGYDGKQFDTNFIEHWLSEPRLNYSPINLALLLDITFCEFNNEKTKKIVENSEWRSLIMNNEIFLLKNYYDVISNHINSPRHIKENLVRDICSET